MAKTITLNECPAPTNPTATAVAGGSLTAGTTYYYRIFAVGPGDSFYEGNNAMFWLSAPCSEVSATTDAANKSIELYWDNPVDSNGFDGEVFIIFRTEISGDYDVYKNDTFYPHVLMAGSINKAYGLTKSQCTPSGAGYKYTDDGSKSLANCPFFTDGVPCWEIEGGSDNDPITPEDLYEWAVTNGKTYCIEKWDAYPGFSKAIAVRTVASIRQPQPGTTSLYFAIPNRTYFLQPWGKTWFDSDGHFRTGEIEDGIGKYGGIWQRYGNYGWYSGCDGGFEMYEGSIIGCPREEPYPTLGAYRTAGHMWQMRSNSDVKIYRSLYEPRAVMGSAGRIYSNNLDLQSNKMHVYGMNLGSPDAIIDDCEMENYIRSMYDRRQGKISNSVFVNPHTWDFMGQNVSSTEDQVTILENITFANTPPDIKGNIANLTHTAHQVVLEQYTIDIKITDKDGVAIENAVFTVEDKNGYGAIWADSGETLSEAISIGETDWTVSDGSVFSIGDSIRVNREVLTITNIVGDVLTVSRGQEGTEDRQYASLQKIFKRSDSLSSDANGELALALVRREYWLDPSNYSTTGYRTMENTVDNAPFILKITKFGYETYEYEFTPDEKENWEIALKASPVTSIFLTAVPTNFYRASDQNSDLYSGADISEQKYTPSPKTEQFYTKGGRNP